MGDAVPEIEFDVTSEDLVAFNLHALESSEYLSRQLHTTRLILALVTPALIFLGIGVASGDVPAGAVIAIATGVVMWFVSPYLSRRRIDSNVRKMAADTGLGQTGRHHLAVSDEGLQEVTPSTSVVVAWSGISRIDETADHAFIYFSPVQAFVIPKRIGDDEVPRFLAEVRDRLATNRVPT